ncbi:hypothetical protein AVEN_131979-1 [Araneus ventricosus]|uniref:Uncharacterized protein n=1 Tax=Araneus ventricosus TaxID=182803 RepID=A0A4Y2B2M8_ARAVE|nr:hypothetical protein AVEN_131979-1 [Araneus ventricosus]
MLIGQVQALLELRWNHKIIQTHFKKKGIAISLSHISRIKNSKLGSTKNDSKPIKNGRQGKLKKSDLQRLEKMASKPDPSTQASMAKALNISQQVNRRESSPSSTVPHPKGVMVWMGISANGFTKPWFVQPGAKINSEYYIQKILKPFLKDDYCRLYPNSDAVFHQDSAPLHASRVTQKFFMISKCNSCGHNNGCQTVLTLHHGTISYGDI